MKLTYDPRYNVAYLRLHEKTAAVETIHVSDELNVDVAPDGTIYGIELLNANEQLADQDGGKFVLVNSANKDQAELTLDLATAPAIVRERPARKYGRKP
jgi:uncharacterized protein YuzE